jgi:thiamine biosynthesis lipoprotein
MATSGDYATRFSDDYVRHHIFNPATGQSPPELASVTVLAPSGLLADGLSTAILVLGQVRGFQLLRSFPGTEALVINKDGRTAQTANFPLVDRPD